MNIKEAEAALQDIALLSASEDDGDIAVVVSCAGMNNYYTVCPSEFKDFLDNYEGLSYVAFDWVGIPDDLQDEEIDFDGLLAWFNLDEAQREICECLYDNNVCMSYEDAAEKVDECNIFNGSEEEYAQEVVTELMGINLDDMPTIVSSNINWGDVFIDLDADGNIYKLEHDKFLTTQF